MAMANWVDLPQDLLEKISDFCILPDNLRMLYVCKPWRSILLKKSTHLELPWLMMLPSDEEKEEDPDCRVFFSLSNQKLYNISLPEIRGKRCCASFQNGWLMTVDENLDICLFHPWSKKKINLPHQSTFMQQELTEEFCSKEKIRDNHIRKVAISDDGNVVVFLHGLGYLGLCRIGDDAYTDIEVDTLMEDVIYHKGRFYALNQVAAVYLLHLEDGILSPHGEDLTPKLEPAPPFTYAYLAPDILTNTLFVITRQVEHMEHDGSLDEAPHKTIHLDIYGLPLGVEEEEGPPDERLKKLKKVESLGDRVLFLGYNSPFVVLASQFPSFKGNCIYFTDNTVDFYFDSPYGCRDLGVFYLKDGTTEELFADRFHPIFSPPSWIAMPPYSIYCFDGDGGSLQYACNFRKNPLCFHIYVKCEQTNDDF